MQSSDLLVEVRDVSLTRRAQIAPRFLDLTATLRDSAPGDWTLRLPAEHPAMRYLVEPGSGVIVTGPEGVLFSGPTTTPKTDADLADPSGIATVAGVTDDVLLWQRLAYPSPTVADVGAQTSAYDVRQGSAEAVMLDYVRANLGALAPAVRRVAALDTSPSQGRGGAILKSARFNVLGDLLREIATVAGLRFRVVQNGARLAFEVLDIRDRRGVVRFDLVNGTLSSQSVAQSAPGLTRAIVAGQGEGADRTLIERVSVASAAAEKAYGPWGRIERFIDQRNTDEQKELEQAGDKALAEEGSVATAAMAVPSDDLTMRFVVDWTLGDRVTVVVDGQETDSSVTAATIIANAETVRVGAAIGDVADFDPKSALGKRVDDTVERVSNLERNVEIASRRPKAIPAGADLNDYRTTGVYSVASNAIAPTMSNLPTPRAGLLTVQASHDNDIHYQEFTTYEQAKFTRAYQGWNSTWKPWAPLDRGFQVAASASAERALASLRSPTLDSPLLVYRPDLGPVPQLRMTNDGVTWAKIETTPQGASWTRPTLASGWKNYGSSYAAAGFLRLSSGIVVLGGLVAGGASGDVLFTLPEGYRPDRRTMLSGSTATSGGTGCRVDVLANGDVLLVNVDPGWTSLDGLMFPAAGVATWEPLPLVNSFTAYNEGAYGVPAYWVDPHGRVWFRGLVTRATTPTADLPIGQLPAHLAPLQQLHMHGMTWGNVLGGVDVAPKKSGDAAHLPNNPSIRFKQGGNVSWISLASVMYLPDYTAARRVPYANAWAAYNSVDFPNQEFIAHPDGLVQHQGLIRGGALNTVSGDAPTGARPSDRRIYAVAAANAWARTDAFASGGIQPMTGAAAWRSNNGINYVLEN